MSRSQLRPALAFTLVLAVPFFAAAAGRAQQGADAARPAATPTAAATPRSSSSPQPAATPAPAASPATPAAGAADATLETTAMPAPAPPPQTMAELLQATRAEDWRPLDPENTLYLELASGRVVIELAPDFAPNHVANVKQLARQGYFDGLAVLRSQDNYVVQWGDPNGEDETKRRSFGEAEGSLAAEMDRAAAGLPFAPLPDGDVYAPEAGVALGFPVARDPVRGRAWLAHCYGMVGAGRGNTSDSGSGAELYVVIGHSPRHLDRNVTLLGRVVQGMELLSALPRGTGGLGFYTDPAQHVPLRSLRVAADVPVAERTALELLRTDTPTFERLIAVRRTRQEDWFLDPVGRIELCNVPLPVRPLAPPAPATGS
jgi:peptidylprolyl isomerase